MERADEAAFVEEVRRIALAVLPRTMDRAVRHDLAQETCVDVLAHRDALDRYPSLAACVNGAVRLRLRTFLRSERRRATMAEAYQARRVAEPAPLWGDPHASLEMAEATALATRTIAAMPRVRREIWVAVRMDDRSLAEVAEARGISRESVKTHLRLASEQMCRVAEHYVRGER